MQAITDPKAIIQAYTEFAREVTEGGVFLNRRIGHPGGTEHTGLIWHERLQFWVSLHPERLDNRYWCLYGIEYPQPTSVIPITCEINPSKAGDDRRCAGLFVRDESGSLYLAHSGRVGGGREGIGKERFLTHLGDAAAQPISFPNGEVWDYIIIGRVAAHDFLPQLATFIHTVAQFKDEVAG
jgi:hypothetical protein